MRRSFLGDDFLLNSETASLLYHDYAKVMPIIDYHNHFPSTADCRRPSVRKYNPSVAVWRSLQVARNAYFGCGRVLYYGYKI